MIYKYYTHVLGLVLGEALVSAEYDINDILIL